MSSVGLVIARMNTPVPRHIAWAHLVDPELRQNWWAELQLDATLGGTVSERWNGGCDSTEADDDAGAAMRDAVGTVDVMVQGHALGFRWRDRSDAYETEVLITLRSSDAGTGITVTETGFGRFLDGRNRAADAQQGWIDLLTDCVAVLSQVEFDPEEVARQAPAPAPKPASTTSEIDVIPPVVEAELEDDVAIDDVAAEAEELEVEAERVLAELVAEVPTINTETLQDAPEASTPEVDTPEADTPEADTPEADTPEADALVVDAEPEAVEIEVEPEDPDFDTILRGN